MKFVLPLCSALTLSSVVFWFLAERHLKPGVSRGEVQRRRAFQRRRDYTARGWRYMLLSGASLVAAFLVGVAIILGAE